jgi:hypothetical protein
MGLNVNPHPAKNDPLDKFFNNWWHLTLYFLISLADTRKIIFFFEMKIYLSEALKQFDIERLNIRNFGGHFWIKEVKIKKPQRGRKGPLKYVDIPLTPVFFHFPKTNKKNVINSQSYLNIIILKRNNSFKKYLKYRKSEISSDICG